MKRWFVVVWLLCLLSPAVRAVEPDSLPLEVPGLDALLETAEDHGVPSGGGLDGGLSALWAQAMDALDEVLRGGLRTGVCLLAVVVLCSMAQGAAMGGEPGGMKVTAMAGALAVTALSVGEMGRMIALGRQAIGQMDEFAGLLLPVMASLTAATGKATAAAARQGIAVLFSQLLISLIHRLLIPMVYAYLAACCAGAALGNDGLRRAAGLLKWAAGGILTTLLLSYVAYLSVSGAVAGAADAAMVKAAKMAMSRAIPVVGGILSDAAETMLAGAGVLRGTVGVAGMLAVLAICLVPFLHLAVHYLTYKLAAALAGTVADSRLTGLIDSISSAFGLVLGMTGSCALVLLVSLVASISAVTA